MATGSAPSPGDTSSSPLASAEDAVTLASVNPGRARKEAIRVLRANEDLEVRLVAIRALGLACAWLGNAATAMHHMDRAVTRAERSGMRHRAGQARISRLAILAERGEIAAALADADRAAELVTGADATRLLAQRGIVLGRIGRFDDALACFSQALPRLRDDGDTRFEAGVLANLGELHVYRGDIAQAETQLARCEDLADRAGLDHLITLARWNRAQAAVRRGDIPRTLALLDDVQARLDRPGDGTSNSWAAFADVDRAAALIHANLVGEARAILTPAVERIEASGFAANCAEARLTLARAELLDGAFDQAAHTADLAHSAFVRQRRVSWAHLAGNIKVQARWERGERTRRLLDDAAESAHRLSRWGWEEGAAAGHIVAGRLALEFGDLERTDAELTEAGRTRTAGPVPVRVAAWHATALRRLAHDDRRGAEAALRAGLRAVDQHAASLGATDLRVHAVGWGEELAALGMRLALAKENPRSVFAWIERWRAGATRHRPVRPPDDRELATALADLRRVTGELGQAASEGRDIRSLRARQVRLEDEIRRQCRHARGTYRSGRTPPSPEALRDALGERAFVTYTQHAGQLAAVTVVRGRARLFHLGPYTATLSAMEALRFCNHRLARRHGSSQSLRAARMGLTHAGAHLDRLLIEPLARHVGDRDVVLAPTGRLHAMPWSALPSLAGRPLTVTPSAAMWLDISGADRAREPGRHVLAAGPGLHHADTEVRDLAGHYPHATTLTGSDAGAEAVRSAIDGAELAHLAAHGRFRADNPLFSSISLADGPLMVYDMERLRQAPRRIVLSSCDAAVSAVRPGGELMGLASALLSLGTTTLVASVSPVNDEETQALMVALHERLSAGHSPARALADATRTSGVLGFTCFGAG